MFLELLTAEAFSDFGKRAGRLFASDVNQFPEFAVGLQNHRFPILLGDSDKDCRRLTTPRDDNTFFLSPGHKFIGSLFEILDRRPFHKISFVVRPVGFFRMARIYTTRRLSATS